jgi:hypothetical protein
LKRLMLTFAIGALLLFASTASAKPRFHCKPLKGSGVAYWRCEANYHADWVRELQGERRRERASWATPAIMAIRLASRVTGVSEAAMRSVAFCESRLYPFAQNGRYKGLFQLGWSPFGLSPFDPYANALSAAMTVARQGWRQWECKP